MHYPHFAAHLARMLSCPKSVKRSYFFPPPQYRTITLENQLVVLATLPTDAGNYYVQAVNEKNGENKTSPLIYLNVTSEYRVILTKESAKEELSIHLFSLQVLRVARVRHPCFGSSSQCKEKGRNIFCPEGMISTV